MDFIKYLILLLSIANFFKIATDLIEYGTTEFLYFLNFICLLVVWFCI